MSSKIMEKASPDPDAATNPTAPHPLDVWLKHELQTFYGASDRDSLPPGIVELAAQLEEKLKNEGGENTDGKPERDGTRQGKTRQGKPDRTSPRRDSKL